MKAVAFTIQLAAIVIFGLLLFRLPGNFFNTIVGALFATVCGMCYLALGICNFGEAVLTQSLIPIVVVFAGIGLTLAIGVSLENPILSLGIGFFLTIASQFLSFSLLSKSQEREATNDPGRLL